MSPNFDRQFTKQIDKEVSGKKDMETLPFDREEVINAFLDYANAEKEYNKENGYSISSTPLSQSKEQQIAEDPDYKKVLEKEHEELVDKLYKNAQDLKKIFEEKLGKSGLDYEDPEIKRISEETSYWQ